MNTLRVLHLGLGSFHRAHQAVYLQRLHAAGDTRWTLASGNIRPDGEALVDALRGQGGAYTLETVTPEGERSYERITSLAEVVPWDAQLARVVALGADAATRVISFTVTEAGYAPGAELYRALTAILRARQAAEAGPVTLLCCDNLRHNGDRSRAGLLQHVEAEGDAALLAWVQANTSSPNCMVDRITPRPSPDVRERVRAATSVDDPAALMAESYLQWVIEDRFIAGRPAWEAAGAEVTSDVAPYEEAKIRLLNAAHSCIAWAGTLAGHLYIHEGTQDARVRAIAQAYASEDVIPVLQPSPVDLPAYRDMVLRRFGNAVIRDTNARVFADSYAKLAGFIAPTVRDRLARNESIEAVAMLPALYLACLQKWRAGQLPFDYEDAALSPAAARALCDAADPLLTLAQDAQVWGAAAGDARLVDALRRAGARVNEFQGQIGR